MLAELMFEVMPIWCEKLGKYIKEAEDRKKSTSGIIITPSGVYAEEDNSPKILTPGIDIDGAAATGGSPGSIDKSKAAENCIPHRKKSLAVPHGICRLDAKPGGSKARFSSLTGPVIMYDGESQHMLNELWTCLNNKRGGLRREMMTVKRRQELASPRPRMMPNICIEVESETDGNSSVGKEDDLEQSNEMLRLRLKMEREKMKRMNRRTGGVGGTLVGGAPLGALTFKRARTMAGPPVSAGQAVASAPSGLDQKLKTLLEDIDDNLDKACKVTETVAFVWLKGDGYEGHLKLIVGRLKDTVAKIEASGFVPPKTEEASPAHVAAGSNSDSKAKEMPAPLTSSPCPELGRKKSDATMRDRYDPCLVSPAAASTVKACAEQAKQSVKTIPASIEVGLIKDEITNTYTPAAAILTPDILATGKAAEESSKPLQPRANSLDPEVIEVDDDDDDEGIVC